MSEVKRYDMIAITRCGEPWQELEPGPEGDWMHFDDHRAAVKELCDALKKLLPYLDVGCDGECEE